MPVDLSEDTKQYLKELTAEVGKYVTHGGSTPAEKAGADFGNKIYNGPLAINVGDPKTPETDTHPVQPTSDFSRLHKLSLDQMLSMPAEAHSDENLAMGDVSRNVNGKSPEKTRRYAQLRDAWAQKYYRTPMRSAYGLMTSKGVDNTHRTDFGQLYQMPFDTIDSRQYKRMEGYEGDVRRREVDRQQNYRDRDLERGNKLFDEELRRSGAYSDEERRRLAAHFDQGMKKDFTLFNAYLYNIGIKGEQAKILHAAYINNGPAFANLLASLWGSTMPSPDTWIMDQRIANIIRNPEMGTEAKLAALAQVNAQAVITMFQNMGIVGIRTYQDVVDWVNKGGKLP